MSSETGAGGTFIFFLISLPFIWMIFSFSVDHQFAAATRDAIEHNAQSAITSAATQLNATNGMINTTEARRIAIEQYTDVRETNIRHVRCARKSDLSGSETLQGGTCKWILKGFKRSANGRTLYMSIKEIKPATMSKSFNKKGYTLNIDVSSTLRASN